MSTIFPLTANVCVFCFAFLTDVRAFQTLIIQTYELKKGNVNLFKITRSSGLQLFLMTLAKILFKKCKSDI